MLSIFIYRVKDGKIKNAGALDTPSSYGKCSAHLPNGFYAVLEDQNYDKPVASVQLNVDANIANDINRELAEIELNGIRTKAKPETNDLFRAYYEMFFGTDEGRTALIEELIAWEVQSRVQLGVDPLPADFDLSDMYFYNRHDKARVLSFLLNDRYENDVVPMHMGKFSVPKRYRSKSDDKPMKYREPSSMNMGN